MKAEQKPAEEMSLEELSQNYREAVHAMQTLVSLDHATGGAHDGTPKHLRVGVNSAFVSHGALVALLMEKGIITEREYRVSLLNGARAEVERYRQLLKLPDNVKTL